MAVAELSRTESHYRQFLAGRWKRVRRLTLILCISVPVLLSTAQFAIPRSWGALAWDIACILAGGMAIFLLCGWPLHILRTMQLSPIHTSSTAPQISTLPATTVGALTLNLLSDAKTGRVVAWYMWTSWVVTIVTAEVLSASSEVDVKLGLFNGTRLYPNHLNERLIFLLISTSYTSVLHSLYSILTSSSPSTITYKSLSWPSNTPLTPVTRKARLYEEARKRVVILIMGAVALGVVEWFGYYFGRGLFWGSVVRAFGWPAKQFLVRFALARTNPLSLGLLVRLILIQLAIFLVIEAPAAMFSVFTTQPLDFSPLVAKSGAGADKYLADALQSKDLFLMNFTMSEINDVSYDPSRRKAILGDLSTKPTLWTTLWQGLMIQLGISRRILNTQGGRLISAPAAPTASGASGEEPGVQSLRVVRPEAVFRIAPTKAIAGSWADRALNKANVQEQSIVAAGTKIQAAGVTVQATATSTFQQLYLWTTKALGLANNGAELVNAKVVHREKPLAIGDKAKETVEKVKTTAEKAQEAAGAAIQQKSRDVVRKGTQLLESDRVKPGWNILTTTWDCVKMFALMLWWGVTELADRIAKLYARILARRWLADELSLVLPRQRMDEKAIRALTAFIVNSYTEDQYGQVQQNVASTLEAFAKLHSELSAYRTEVIGKAQQQKRSGIWVAVVERTWDTEVQPVLRTLEVCIRSIRAAFGTDMQALKFPPDVAKLLDKAASSGL